MQGGFFSKLRGIILSLFFGIVGTVGGILFGIMLFSDLSSVSLAEFVFLFLMMCFMLLLGCFGILLLLYNKGAYFSADDAGISAKFGLHDPLNWTWEEILRIELAPNTLTVKLKNEKTYLVPFLVNARELYDYCKAHLAKRKIPSAEVIRAEIQEAKQKRKKYIAYIVFAFATVFGAIFFSAYYVGEDLHALAVPQTIVFVCCTILEIAAVVVAFILADRSGKYTRKILDLQIDFAKAFVQEKTAKELALPHVVRLLYFEDCRWRVAIHKTVDERRETFYCYVLELFDFETEDWTTTTTPVDIFGTEIETLDAIYELYADTIFEEYVN